MSKVTEALIGLSGLGVANDQTRDIVKMFNNLREYDKKPVMLCPAGKGLLCGTFVKCKRVGHISMEKMKRFPLSFMA